MAEELQLGKLVAEIVLENNTEQGVAEAVESIKQVENIANNSKPTIELNTKNDETIIYIKEVLSQLGIKGKEASNILNSCFNDVSSLRKYQQQLEIIAQKLEQQRSLISELEVITKKQPLYSSDYKDIDRAIKALDGEKIKLMELELQFDKTYEAQDNFLKKQVTGYQKQATASVTAAEKQVQFTSKLNNKEAGANFAQGINLANTSLRTFESIAPDIVSSIGEIITQMNAIKQAKSAGSSGIAGWATAIVAGVGIVAGLIVNYINDINQKADESRQKAAQLSEEYNTSQDTLSSLASEYLNIKTRLEYGNLTQNESIEAKKSLLEIQKRLIDQYGAEADGIDLTTGAINSQTEAIENLSLENARYILAANANDYDTAKKELNKEDNLFISYSRISPADFQKDMKDLLSEYGDIVNGNYNNSINIITNQGNKATVLAKIYAGLQAIKDKYKDDNEIYGIDGSIGDHLTEIMEQITTALDGLPVEKIKEWKNIVTGFEFAGKVLFPTDNQKTQKETKAIQEKIRIIEKNITSLSSLRDAYASVSAEQELNADTITQMCEQYPKLAKYIADTGDTTFKNGEKIKQVYEEEYQATIISLEVEKQKMIQNNESSESIDEISAKILIYKMNLESINSVDFSQAVTEFQNLGNAYATVSAGQSLDFNNLIQLIDTYPAFAEAVATGSLSLANQADVIKYLFDVKKAEAQQSLINDQEKIESLRNSTQEIINQIKLQIAAIDQLHGGWYGNLFNELSDNTALQDRYNEQLAQTAAKLQALDKISIESYKHAKTSSTTTAVKNQDDFQNRSNVSDKNELLSEELKQLEQRKKLNALTAKEEYEWLNAINGKYAQNAQERDDMEYKLYQAKKQMQADEEKAAEEALQSAYKGIENKKALGQMTSKEELDALQEIKHTYRLNIEQAMQLEIKLYNLKKDLKSAEKAKLNSLGDAITAALKEKYTQQKELEQEHINTSIDNWKNWEDKTVDAINGQITALDELSKTQDNEDKRQEYEKNRQSTALELAYEKDNYNRKQLQKELNRIDNEEAKRLAEVEREKQKKALQNQITEVKDKATAAQDKLQDELDKVTKNYEDMTTSGSLREQAENVLLSQSPIAIFQFIKRYAGDYGNTFSTLADDVYNKLQKQVGNVDGYILQINRELGSMLKYAQKAADDYWSSRAKHEKDLANLAAPTAVEIHQTINFNEPVQSPVAVKKQLEIVANNLANQIAGG